MTIGFGLQEIYGGLGSSRAMRGTEVAAGHHSFERPYHERKSWNERWSLSRRSGRSLCPASKIQRVHSLTDLEEIPQELLSLNLLTNLVLNHLLEPNLFVNKGAFLNYSLSHQTQRRV